MDQARAIALRAHPGTIADAELENEGGGSGLRYSFDITSGGKEFEVGVDAMTGAVLENQAEGPESGTEGSENEAEGAEGGAEQPD